MTLDCRRLAFLVLTMLAATRAPAAAQAGGGQSASAPTTQSAPVQPAGTPPATAQPAPPTGGASDQRTARQARSRSTCGSRCPASTRAARSPVRSACAPTSSPAAAGASTSGRTSIRSAASASRSASAPRSSAPSGSKAPDPEDETAVRRSHHRDELLCAGAAGVAELRHLARLELHRRRHRVHAALHRRRRCRIRRWPRLTGIHYGGGARWFISQHVAFNFDMRFYRIPEQEAEGTTVPFQPKSRMFLITAGLSFK